MREGIANDTRPCSQINNIEKASRCQKATTLQGKSFVCVRVEVIYSYFISFTLNDELQLFLHIFHMIRQVMSLFIFTLIYSFLE